MGAMEATDVNERVLFQHELRAFMESQGFSSYGDVEQCLREVLWIDEIHSPRFRICLVGY